MSFVALYSNVGHTLEQNIIFETANVYFWILSIQKYKFTNLSRNHWHYYTKILELSLYSYIYVIKIWALVSVL